MERFIIQQGSIADLDLLTRHRLMMWKDIYPEKTEVIEATENITRNWIRSKLLNNELTCFIVRDSNGSIAGSGCILIKEDQPRPTSSRLDYPYLLSMYTEKNYRRRGVGSLIVNEAIEWSKKHGFDRIVLHASKDGKPLYVKFGFRETNEMRLELV
jgi:GNAT superfamily N-acetyltransferase